MSGERGYEENSQLWLHIAPVTSHTNLHLYFSQALYILIEMMRRKCCGKHIMMMLKADFCNFIKILLENLFNKLILLGDQSVLMFNIDKITFETFYPNFYETFAIFVLNPIQSFYLDCFPFVKHLNQIKQRKISRNT